MAQTTKNLRLTMQETNDNPDTWGTVLNNSVFKMLEDAVVKREVLDGTVTGSTISLGYGNGEPDPVNPDARAMMLDCIDNPGGPVTIIAPIEGGGAFGSSAEYAKVYLVRNAYSPAYDITFKTATGTGVTIPNGETRLVFVDSTDAYLVDSGDVTNAINATNAENADNLLSDGGYVTGEDFVRKDLGVGTSKVQTFTQGQNAVREALTWGSTIAVPNQNSNAFNVTVTSAISATFQNPTTQTADADGQVIRIMIHHQTSGATITWGSAYAWVGGTPPTLTTGSAGAVDYVAFEYFRNYPGGGKWVGSALLDVS